MAGSGEAFVTIEGLDEWVRACAASPRIAEEEIEDAAYTVLAHMIGELTEYPPAPSGSTYQRTGKLRRGWQQNDARFVFRGGKVDLKLVNPVEYSGYVQGEDQAWMHRGRWKRAKQIEDDFGRDMELTLAQALVSAEGRIQAEGD